MRTLKLVVFLFFFLSSLFCAAQSCTITGKIIDSKSLEAVPFANVFLNNTTIGTVTEVSGEFTLKNVQQPSVHELIISFVGYETYKTKISLSSGELKMGVIRLKPSEIELSTVEVKGSRDVEWEKKLKKFKKVFLGEDEMAAQCDIKNAWVINFRDDIQKNSLVATASAPIEIENNALGYKLNFYLISFVADATSYSILGNVRFDLLKSDDPKIVSQWDINREKSFFGSSQHLFKSILDRKIKGEGFNIYTDMLGFENSTTRSSQFRQDLGKTIIAMDTTSMLSMGAQKDVFKISWKGKMEVHYRKEKTSTTIYQDIRYPISWLTLKKGFVLINKTGVPLNPSDITISGAMSNDRIAHMLPLDYLPFSQVPDDIPQQTLADTYNLLYEKIYIHTDRPYYYPGETLWLKGYMNYAVTAMRDSLSRTVYVELINGSNKKIVQSKILKIDSGTFHSDFILPDTLKALPYFLRAYTNWNRNYGDENLYTLYVPVIELNEKPEKILEYEASSSPTLTIATDKTFYGPREKINLTLALKDAEGNPLGGNLSLSVTDARQVVQINTVPSILEEYPVKNIVKPLSKPTFPIEYGIAFSGRISLDGDKAGRSSLNVFQVKSSGYFMTETDANGVFSLNGLEFYDNSKFSFKVNKDAKGKLKSVKKVQLLPRQIPEVNFISNFTPITLQKANAAQRDKSAFELAANTRLLKEVTIKDSKLEETSRRPYGKPDYVIKAKDLNTSYGNLLQTLPGKVPGLIVRQDPNGNPIVYMNRSGTGSISNAKEVIVMVNDVFVGGSAGEALSSINPSSVETVEVKAGINVLFGGVGGSGIVSIYTKKNADQGIVHEDQAILVVPGYQIPRLFPATDHSNSKNENPDNRSLLYWNPSINTNAKTGLAQISFYGSDSGGPYHVEVEGINASGEPVKGEYLITVNNKRN